MNRQFRRRIEREWNKIKLDSPCTKFVERNNLFAVPYILYFHALKIGEDLMVVYHVGLFEFKKGSGYLEHVTICQFVDSSFRRLGSLELGFVSEENLDNDGESQIETIINPNFP
jgi:hypothetical protein